MDDDRNFSVTVAAQHLGVSRSFFYSLLAKGSIRAVKLGSRTIIPGREIRRFMERIVGQQENAAAFKHRSKR